MKGGSSAVFWKRGAVAIATLTLGAACGDSSKASPTDSGARDAQEAAGSDASAMDSGARDAQGAAGSDASAMDSGAPSDAPDAGADAGARDSGSAIGGTAAGKSFTAQDAVFASAVPQGSCPMYGLLVTVSGAAGACSRAGDACLGKGNLLELQLSMVDASAIGAGAYDVVAPDPSQPPPAGKIVGVLAQTNSSCQAISPESLPHVAAGSSATLASVSDGEVSGSVDVSFSDGGKLSGAFFALRCSALAPASGFCAPPSAPVCSGTPTCQ